MSLLIFAIVVILILALVIWAIRMLPMIDANLSAILQVLAVLVAVLAIAQRAGVF